MNRFATSMLRALGAERLNGWFRVMFGGEALPMAGADPASHDWSEDQLLELRRSARYYFWGNFLRFLWYIPLLPVLMNMGSSVAGVVLGLIFWYAAVVLHEIYRYSLSWAVAPSTTNTELGLPEYPGPPRGYFLPNPFETPKFYERMGFALVRRIVAQYTRITRRGRGEKGECKQSFIGNGSPGELAAFEVTTRTSEAVHLIAGSLNIPIILVLLPTGSFWALYSMPILALDIVMALLQRYHRVRVIPILARMQRRTNG